MDPNRFGTRSDEICHDARCNVCTSCAEYRGLITQVRFQLVFLYRAMVGYNGVITLSTTYAPPVPFVLFSSLRYYHPGTGTLQVRNSPCWGVGVGVAQGQNPKTLYRAGPRTGTYIRRLWLLTLIADLSFAPNSILPPTLVGAPSDLRPWPIITRCGTHCIDSRCYPGPTTCGGCPYASVPK
jgi:hypothetical protein